MAAIQRALERDSHYLELKTPIIIVTRLDPWGLLDVLDVLFAFVWCLLAFALNYIPNFGSVLAALAPIILVLVFFWFYDA
ncbi:AI-2E family transporter, partial [Salmonella enterica subsp. enterica serovar Infantis]